MIHYSVSSNGSCNCYECCNCCYKLVNLLTFLLLAEFLLFSRFNTSPLGPPPMNQTSTEFSSKAIKLIGSRREKGSGTLLENPPTPRGKTGWGHWDRKMAHTGLLEGLMSALLIGMLQRVGKMRALSVTTLFMMGRTLGHFWESTPT